MSVICLRSFIGHRQLLLSTYGSDCSRHGQGVDCGREIHEEALSYCSDYDGIRDADISFKSKTLPPLEEMGEEDGPAKVIMISLNLGNSAHIDYADASR
jgi:hypothetical protein